MLGEVAGAERTVFVALYIEAPNLCRGSLPQRGVGHEEETKKECEKGKPSREHERGRVLGCAVSLHYRNR